MNSFRILSYSPWPFGANYEELNHANLTVARVLRSVNGYDPMRLDRPAEIAGEMDIFGVVRRTDSFKLSDQGFNLLNVKYLLYEQPAQIAGTAASSIQINGVRFKAESLDLSLRPGRRWELGAEGATADEIAFVSTMADSTQVPDNAQVARITIHTKDGRRIEREILAGRDSSEWAYDRPDVSATIKHKRAPVAESWDADGFQAHRYLARFSFERAEVERAELEMPQQTANSELLILRASLHDTETARSTALAPHLFPTERWRKLAGFGQVGIYENLKFLPRAWFIRNLVAVTRAEALRAIKEGRLPDGSDFNPSQTALLETEDFGHRPVQLPPVGDPTDAEVKITLYEPRRIELQTRNTQPGFMVLSENYYRGWEAWIGGERTPVERVNYTLRGVAVPPGQHRIEFVFQSHSFRLGVVCSAVGIALLLIGTAVVNYVRT